MEEIKMVINHRLISAIICVLAASTLASMDESPLRKKITMVFDRDKNITSHSLFNIQQGDSITIKTPGKACKVRHHFDNFYMRCDKVLDARDIELAAFECYDLFDRVPTHYKSTIDEMRERLQDKTRILIILKAGDHVNVSLVAEPQRTKLQVKSYFDLTAHDNYRYHLKKVVEESIGAFKTSNTELTSDHTVDFISFARAFKAFVEELVEDNSLESLILPR